MVTASFRFHDELNEFLPLDLRGRDITRPCAREASAKHMIEALGVPHTEVGRLLVNDREAELAQRLAEGDRVEAYPGFGPPGQPPPAEFRFVADAHLGGLARLLRLAGFDTLYDNGFQDDQIVALAETDRRVVLTRDRELLKRKEVDRGCFLHAIKPERQLAELFRRLDLAPRARPFRLCLACNAPLRPIPKADVLDRLPPAVRQSQDRFATCVTCGGVFWEGSHWRRMTAVLAGVGGCGEGAGG